MWVKRGRSSAAPEPSTGHLGPRTSGNSQAVLEPTRNDHSIGEFLDETVFTTNPPPDGTARAFRRQPSE
jgi:hypothetical protein